MMEFTINANRYTGRVETGTRHDEQEERIWEFGMTAEVFVSDRGFGQDGWEATVTMSGVGTHSPTTGRQRLAAYESAIEIAEFLNDLEANGETELFEALAALAEAKSDYFLNALSVMNG